MEEVRFLYINVDDYVREGDVVDIRLKNGDIFEGYRVLSWEYPMLTVDSGHGVIEGINIDHIGAVSFIDRYRRKQESKEMVNHPDHYQSKTGLEAWDVIEAFTSDLNGIEAFDTGNVLKYMCRWKGKNGLEDLKKAKRYLEHLIDHVENSKKEND